MTQLYRRLESLQSYITLNREAQAQIAYRSFLVSINNHIGSPISQATFQAFIVKLQHRVELAYWRQFT